MRRSPLPDSQVIAIQEYRIIEAKCPRVQVEIVGDRIVRNGTCRPGDIAEGRCSFAVFLIADEIVAWRTRPYITMIWLRRVTYEAGGAAPQCVWPGILRRYRNRICRRWTDVDL